MHQTEGKKNQWKDGRKFWIEQEDQILKNTKYNSEAKTWKEISQLTQGRSAKACVQRWKKIHPIKSQRLKWTLQEDSQLLELEALYGNNWQMIANKMKSKTGVKVRERYINHLKQGINKKQWSEDEDAKLLELYQVYGNSWTKISKFMIGRPVNQIKNRFYGHLEKLMQNSNKQLQETIVEQESEVNCSQFFISNSSPQQKTLINLEFDYF